MKQLMVIVLCLLAFSGPAYACIWDRDTLVMERAKFPEVNELIVGYFPRHSTVYYQWRLDQVLAIPAEERTASDYDDLGVSYDKLGQYEQAIATMLEKSERFPNEGVYETHANLGTFYIHHGDFEQGAQYIGSAIEINPDAHFGREIYQKLLVEYVLEQRAKGNTLTLSEKASHPWQDEDGFAVYVLNAKGLLDGDLRDSPAHQAEIERATKGILGMMRFGHHDSPILLEALGDLLYRTGPIDGAQRMAARAYLKASYEVDDSAAAEQFREKAVAALQEQHGVRLEDIEDELKAEIAKGDTFFAQIEADEQAWAEAGEDLDTVFTERYYAREHRLTLPKQGRFQGLTLVEELIVGFFTILVLIAIAVAVVYHLRQQKAKG